MKSSFKQVTAAILAILALTATTPISLFAENDILTTTEQTVSDAIRFTGKQTLIPGQTYYIDKPFIIKGTYRIPAGVIIEIREGGKLSTNGDKANLIVYGELTVAEGGTLNIMRGKLTAYDDAVIEVAGKMTVYKGAELHSECEMTFTETSYVKSSGLFKVYKGGDLTVGGDFVLSKSAEFKTSAPVTVTEDGSFRNNGTAVISTSGSIQNDGEIKGNVPEGKPVGGVPPIDTSSPPAPSVPESNERTESSTTPSPLPVYNPSSNQSQTPSPAPTPEPTPTPPPVIAAPVYLSEIEEIVAYNDENDSLSGVAGFRELFEAYEANLWQTNQNAADELDETYELLLDNAVYAIAITANNYDTLFERNYTAESWEIFQEAYQPLLAEYKPGGTLLENTLFFVELAALGDILVISYNTPLYTPNDDDLVGIAALVLGTDWDDDYHYFLVAYDEWEDDDSVEKTTAVNDAFTAFNSAVYSEFYDLSPIASAIIGDTETYPQNVRDEVSAVYPPYSDNVSLIDKLTLLINYPEIEIETYEDIWESDYLADNPRSNYFAAITDEATIRQIIDDEYEGDYSSYLNSNFTVGSTEYNTYVGATNVVITDTGIATAKTGGANYYSINISDGDNEASWILEVASNKVYENPSNSANLVITNDCTQITIAEINSQEVTLTVESAQGIGGYEVYYDPYGDFSSVLADADLAVENAELLTAMDATIYNDLYTAYGNYNTHKTNPYDAYLKTALNALINALDEAIPTLTNGFVRTNYTKPSLDAIDAATTLSATTFAQKIAKYEAIQIALDTAETYAEAIDALKNGGYRVYLAEYTTEWTNTDLLEQIVDGEDNTYLEHPNVIILLEETGNFQMASYVGMQNEEIFLPPTIDNLKESGGTLTFGGETWTIAVGGEVTSPLTQGRFTLSSTLYSITISEVQEGDESLRLTLTLNS